MDVRKLGLSDEDLEALGYRVSRRDEEQNLPRPSGTSPTGRPEARPRNRAARAWLWTVAVLVGVGWLARSEARMPRPVPANQPDSVFSSARAMSQLVEIARAPRPTGSPEHDRVRAYLVDRLGDLGLDVDVQTSTAAVADSGVATAATLRNVVAHLPGTASTGTVLLSARYDGAPLSWAAGGNGIGVAAILEALRALRTAEPLRNDVVVLLSDGGALGSLGARAFLASDERPPGPKVGLVLEAEGMSGASAVLEGDEANGALIRTMATLPHATANATARAFKPSLADGTDATPLQDGGLSTLALVSLGGRAFDGWPMDRPVNVEESTLQHHGSQLLALARSLGDADLSAGAALAGPARTYFSLPLAGLVDYPVPWSTRVTLALVAGFVLLLVLFRVRGGRWEGALAAVALSGGIVGLSALAGQALLKVLAVGHPEYGRVEGLVYDEGLHLLALLGLVLAATTAPWSAGRRWLERRELLVGSLAVPIGCMVAINVLAPHALVALQIPLALALLAAVPLVLVPDERTPVRWVSLGVLALSAGALLLVVPGVEALVGLWTLEAAPRLGAVMAVGGLVLAPVLGRLSRPRAWWTPALGAVVALVAIFLALPTGRGGGQHPTPTSLIHLVDDTLLIAPTDSVSAAPGRSEGATTSSSRIRWMPGRWLTVPGVGEEWARSWVVGTEGGGSDPGPLLLPSAGWIVAGTGAEAEIPAPIVGVVEDASDSGGRRVRITADPGLEAEVLGFRLVDGSAGEVVAVNGREWTSRPPEPVRALRHWGRTDTGTVTIDLRIDAGATRLAFDLIEHHLRPAEVLGSNFFQREDSVVADASTGSDRVIQRTRVEVALNP